MPQLQIVDTSPSRPREPTNLEKILGGFSEQLNQNYENQRDSLELEKIYKKYQDEGQDINRASFDILSNPRIAPTAKVNSIQALSRVASVNLANKKYAERELENRLKTDKKAADELAKRQHEEEQDLLEEDLINSQGYQDLSPIEIYSKSLENKIDRRRAKDLATMARMAGKEQRLNSEGISKLYNSELSQLNQDIKAVGQDDDARAPLLAKKKQLQEMKRRDLQRFNAGERNFTPSVFQEHQDERLTEEATKANPEVAQIIDKITSTFPPSQWIGKKKVHKGSGLEFKSDGVKWVLVQQ